MTQSGEAEAPLAGRATRENKAVDPPLVIHATQGGMDLVLSLIGPEADEAKELLFKLAKSQRVVTGPTPPRRAPNSRVAIMREQFRAAIASGAWVPDKEPIPDGWTRWDLPDRGFFSPQWEWMYYKLVERKIIPQDEAVPPAVKPERKKKGVRSVRDQ